MTLERAVVGLDEKHCSYWVLAGCCDVTLERAVAWSRRKALHYLVIAGCGGVAVTLERELAKAQQLRGLGVALRGVAKLDTLRY